MEKYRNNISILRKLAGLTIDEIAERSGYSRAYINQLQAGSKRLNTDVITILSKILECNPEDLISDDYQAIDTNTKASMKLVLKVAKSMGIIPDSLAAYNCAEAVLNFIEDFFQKKTNINNPPDKKENA